MEFKTALSKLQILSGRVNLLILICLGLLLANICLVGLTGFVFLHQRRTIVPTTVTQAFTVSDYTVDASYLRQVALFFVNERLSIAPSNIKINHNLLLQYTDPEFYHEFSKLLNKEEQEIIKENISSVFYPEEIIPDPENLTVLIKGTLTRWVGGLALTPAKKAYLLKFTYKFSYLKVYSFAEIGENNA